MLRRCLSVLITPGRGNLCPASLPPQSGSGMPTISALAERCHTGGSERNGKL